MKKQIAILLTAAMTFSAFAGSAATVFADDITFWNIATDEPDKTIWSYAVDQYNENEGAESGFRIDQVPTVNDQYKQKLSVAMSAGQCPDAYIHWTGGPMVEYIKSGYAQDLTDLVDKYGLRDLYTEASLAQCTYEDRIYAIPVKNDSVAMFFYDKEMWAEKGYEVPKTIGELEALCEKMVADGITPFALANQAQWTGSMYYMYLVARYGGPEIISAAYDGTGSLVNEATEFAGAKIEEWVEKGFFPQGVNSLSPDNGEDRAMLYQGAGMMLHGSWQIAAIKTEYPEFYEKMGAFPFPALEDSEVDQSVVVGTLGDNFVSINATGDKLEEMFKMCTYYSTPEWMALDIESGNLPPLKAATSEEPAWQDILAVLNDASAVQLWWDQYLPSSVAQVHKSATQKLFDCSATPTEVAQEQQDALDEYHAEQG